MALTSSFLNQTEQKFSINELELLAVLWFCEYIKSYLLRKHFYLLTDQKALVKALKKNRGNCT